MLKKRLQLFSTCSSCSAERKGQVDACSAGRDDIIIETDLTPPQLTQQQLSRLAIDRQSTVNLQ